MKPVAFAYLASYFFSLLGNSIAAIALPLIILQSTGSVLGAGAVAAATALPAVLAGLLMGVLIDRFNRLTSSVVADLISAASLAALPLVALVTDLNVGWFVLFGVIGSLGDVPGMTAREAALPAIVHSSGVSAERLIGVRESLGAIAMVVGPAVAGTLIGLLQGTTVLWITAGTSLLAALITLAIPHRVGALPPAPARASSRGLGWTDLKEGWGMLFSSKFLVAVTIVGVCSAVVLAALQGLVLPVYFTATGQSALLGFVLSALAGGLLIGSLVYAVFARRTSRRLWLVVGLLGTISGFGLIATLASATVIFVGAFVVGAATGFFSSMIGVVTLERIPEHLRGRVTGTQNAIATAAPAIGIVLAAVLTETVSVEVAAMVVASVWAVTAIVALFVRPLRELESHDVPPQPPLRESSSRVG
jgi:MFS family permease